MNIKAVKELLGWKETGKIVDVDYDQKKVYMFSNRNRWVIYNAPIIENGKEIGFYTNFTEEGIVTDTDAKIRSFCGGTFVILLFCRYLKSKGKDFDEIYSSKLHRYIDLNHGKFFDKYGDWLRTSKVQSLVNWEDVELLKE